MEPDEREPVPQAQPASTVPPPQAVRPVEVFTQQWWSSWRRANALGWEYLDAASGLFRQNMAALASATRAWPRGTGTASRR
jgi:hypothetical protein